MRRISCYLFVFFLFGLDFIAAAWTDAPRLSAVNFLRINKEICTAGQPSLQDLELLKEQGVRSVVNLRRPEEDPEAQAEERKRVEELGMNYFLVPVDPSNPRPEQAEAFLKILENEENRPLFIHCRSASRVGAFWLIHRVLHDGWDCSRAEQEARQVGLNRPDLADFAIKYIQKVKPQACVQ